MKWLWQRRRFSWVSPGVRSSDSQGFSLVEILVVLAVLSVLSSVAIFSYGSYRKTLSVRSTAQEFTTLFSTARSLAINSNIPYSATLDLDRQAFWIDEMSGDGALVARPKVTGNAKPADFVRIQSVRFPSGLQDTGLVRILFWPDGRGTSVIIHVRREMDDPTQSSSYTSIRVFSSTGATQVLPRERR